MLADEGRQTGYPGLVMLMNRGSDHDVRAGQSLTIYRETLDGQGPILDLGRATVLSVDAAELDGAHRFVARRDLPRRPRRDPPNHAMTL